MKRICVFCGSSPGNRPEYGIAAEETGRELVRRNIGLVYGGGNLNQNLFHLVTAEPGHHTEHRAVDVPPVIRSFQHLGPKYLIQSPD